MASLTAGANPFSGDLLGFDVGKVGATLTGIKLDGHGAATVSFTTRSKFVDTLAVLNKPGQSGNQFASTATLLSISYDLNSIFGSEAFSGQQRKGGVSVDCNVSGGCIALKSLDPFVNLAKGGRLDALEVDTEGSASNFGVMIESTYSPDQAKKLLLDGGWSRRSAMVFTDGRQGDDATTITVLDYNPKNPTLVLFGGKVLSSQIVLTFRGRSSQ